MKLSYVERWMLSNQYRILEALYPKEAKSFAEQREAIEMGYVAEYDTQVLNTRELSEEDCNRVVDVLDMYRSLTFSYDDLKDKRGIDADDIKFRGFDGNDEAHYLGYCRWFCTTHDGRFTELHPKEGFNSHWRMMPTYQEQLRRYNAVLERRGNRPTTELTNEEILEVLGKAATKKVDG